MDCKVKGFQRAVHGINAHMTMPYALSARIGVVQDVDASMLSISMVVGGQRNVELIAATQHHVCTIGRDAMLLVSPDVMWLTEANDFTGVFEVTSNVEWNVE